MKLAFLILVVLLKFCIAATSEIPLGYHVLKEIKLGQLGLLQLLADKRINKETAQEGIPENARNGILRFLGDNEVEVSRELLLKPRVDIELLEGKFGEKVFFFVAEDWSIEFGSYNGLIFFLYTLENGILVKVKPEISLMSSLKAGWKVKKDKTVFPEIFSISCRPQYDEKKKDVKFNVTYTHFSYDGTRWSAKRKTRPGCWENEEPFPKESLFP